MRLTAVTAVVTGGTSGIGRATAELLASRGATVTIVGSDPDRTRAVAASLGVSARSCDLADPTAAAALARSLAAGSESDGRAPDLVVHSAGIGLRAPAPEAARDRMAVMTAINVSAPMLLTSALLPAMLERGSGHLVFVGSIAGAVGAAGESAYAATKAALAGYADSLRAEIAGSGVHVTLVLPGVVATEFFDRRGMPYHRSRPRPITAARVARGLVRGIERNADLVTVPGWLRVPIALHALAPQLYGRLVGRFGR